MRAYENIAVVQIARQISREPLPKLTQRYPLIEVKFRLLHRRDVDFAGYGFEASQAFQTGQSLVDILGMKVELEKPKKKDEKK